LVRPTGISSKYEEVQQAVLEALEEIGDAAAVPTLLKVWAGRGHLCTRAADALEKIGLAAVPALVQALRDPDRRVSEPAAQALRMMGHAATVPALRQACGHTNQAVPALLNALHSGDWRVREAAAALLGAIGDPEAVAALTQASYDGDREVRVAVVRALELIGDAAAIPPLLRALRDGGDRTRERRSAVAKALWEISRRIEVRVMSHRRAERLP
jgi:HEAT repeat protein